MRFTPFYSPTIHPKTYPLFLELASEDEVELVPAINTNDGEPLDGEKDPVVVVLRLPGLGGNNRGDNGGGFGGFGGGFPGFSGFGGGAQDNGFPFSGKVFNLLLIELGMMIPITIRYFRTITRKYIDLLKTVLIF